MLHSNFPASATQATISAYYWAGIAVGVIPFPSAKDWAFSVIEALDEPPIEIIEIATASDRESAMDALSSASTNADQQAAGRWLLADLHDQLASGTITPMQAARAAMRVVQTTALPQEIWHDFDAFDDELQLAINGTFSTPEEIGHNLLQALRQYSGAT